MPPGQRSEPSIRALVKSASEDAKRLAQAQVQLAQLEMKRTGAQVGKTGGLFIGAAVLAFLGFVFVLVTLAWVLVALGLPYWAGFGIVALLLLIIAGILGFLGKRTADGITGPELSIAEIEKTKAALTGPPPGAVPSVPATAASAAAPATSTTPPGA